MTLLRRLLIVFALTPSLHSQTATTVATPALPFYDAGTVRLNTTGRAGSDVDANLTTFVASNVALRELLQMAFDVRRAQILGIPAWADKARFDINAKITDGDPATLRKLTREQQRLVLQRFMIEHFGLKWHLATRTLPAYALVVAKGGPKMMLSPASCGENDGSTHQSGTDLTATCLRLRFLVDRFSNQLDRPVVDKTGLTARYDFHLRWSRDEARISTPENGSDADVPPTLLTALEDQLGLKLLSSKEPVSVLVIDELKQPVEN